MEVGGRGDNDDDGRTTMCTLSPPDGYLITRFLLFMIFSDAEYTCSRLG